ncbi:MAG: hypothetical protein HC902_04910 [Calothrix sp. SM1_5_4]|nr:hypothetical protein [Calothrix sp. SM1_5_4]
MHAAGYSPFLAPFIFYVLQQPYFGGFPKAGSMVPGKLEVLLEKRVDVLMVATGQILSVLALSDVRRIGR